VVVISAAILVSSNAALAGHSPGGDQTAGRHHIWTERPFYGTNEPPLGHRNVWIVGWRDNGVGPVASVRYLDLGNGTFDVSGEGTFGGYEGRRIISVLYNNNNCTLGASRQGHIAHYEWVQAHPSVRDTYRQVGGEGLKGYRINHPLNNVRSVSVRVFHVGTDFPETEANTTKLACYSLADARPIKL
jgi:hypothetical protein